LSRRPLGLGHDIPPPTSRPPIATTHDDRIARSFDPSTALRTGPSTPGIGSRLGGAKEKDRATRSDRWTLTAYGQQGER
ncbi:MAG: hypothetical protein AABY63_07190, partial [candidate division NC10 bacterium]